MYERLFEGLPRHALAASTGEVGPADQLAEMRLRGSLRQAPVRVRSTQCSGE